MGWVGVGMVVFRDGVVGWVLVGWVGVWVVVGWVGVGVVGGGHWGG